MPHRKQPKKKRGATPPNRLLAMRKQWRKRLAKPKSTFEQYHGATVPLYQIKDKRHREVRDLVRQHHEKKRVKSA